MIKHIWTVLCSESLIDKESNNVSLIKVLEQVNVSYVVGGELPNAIPLDFTVVTLWSREESDTPERGRARIVIVDPTGQESESRPEYEIDLHTYRRFRGTVRGKDIPGGTSGILIFRMQVQMEGEDNWRDVADVPLAVNLEEQQANTE